MFFKSLPISTPAEAALDILSKPVCGKSNRPATSTTVASALKLDESKGILSPTAKVLWQPWRSAETALLISTNSSSLILDLARRILDIASAMRPYAALPHDKDGESWIVLVKETAHNSRALSLI